MCKSILGLTIDSDRERHPLIARPFLFLRKMSLILQLIILLYLHGYDLPKNDSNNLHVFIKLKKVIVKIFNY